MCSNDFFKSFAQWTLPRGTAKLYQCHFWKKFYWEQLDHFGPKIAYVILITLDLLQWFFWRGTMVHEHFSEKIIVYPKWGMMGRNMKRPYNSGFALRIFFFKLSKYPVSNVILRNKLGGDVMMPDGYRCLLSISPILIGRCYCTQGF